MIVSVNKHNINAWAELCNQLWPNSSKEELIDTFKEGKENAFMYRLDNQYIAFINLSIRSDYVEGSETSPVGYVEGIYVKPDYRGQGISRLLIEHAEKWSMDQGFKELASDCELANSESIVFHNRVGFTEANRIVCFIKTLV